MLPNQIGAKVDKPTEIAKQRECATMQSATKREEKADNICQAGRPIQTAITDRQAKTGTQAGHPRQASRIRQQANVD